MSTLKRFRWFLAASCLLMTACAPSTKVTNSWNDPAAAGGALRDVLVIALERSDTARRLWEASFADQLADAGVRAIPVHTIVKEPLPPERQAILDAVKKAGAAMVLITRVVDREFSTTWFPGTAQVEPDPGDRSFYGYYDHAYRLVYEPAMASTETIVHLESKLFRVDTEKLVWSARSATVDPRLLKTDFTSMVAELIADLRSKKLL